MAVAGWSTRDMIDRYTGASAPNGPRPRPARSGWVTVTDWERVEVGRVLIAARCVRCYHLAASYCDGDDDWERAGKCRVTRRRRCRTATNWPA